MGSGTVYALPNVTNKWQSLSVEFKFYMTGKDDRTVGYRYEKFRVKDFATSNPADWNELLRIDYPGGLTMANRNRPYWDSTGAFRIFRMFQHPVNAGPDAGAQP